jgi:predicted nucleotidyltransferase
MTRSGGSRDHTEKEFLQWVAEKLTPLFYRPDLQLAILFGSQAEGKRRTESDIDLALQGDGPLDLVALTTETIQYPFDYSDGV